MADTVWERLARFNAPPHAAAMRRAADERWRDAGAAVLRWLALAGLWLFVGLTVLARLLLRLGIWLAPRAARLSRRAGWFLWSRFLPAFFRSSGRAMVVAWRTAPWTARAVRWTALGV